MSLSIALWHRSLALPRKRCQTASWVRWPDRTRLRQTFGATRPIVSAIKSMPKYRSITWILWIPYGTYQSWAVATLDKPKFSRTPLRFHAARHPRSLTTTTSRRNQYLWKRRWQRLGIRRWSDPEVSRCVEKGSSQRHLHRCPRAGQHHA